MVTIPGGDFRVGGGQDLSTHLFQKEKFLVFGFSHLWWDMVVGAKCEKTGKGAGVIEKILEVGEFSHCSTAS